MSNTLLSVIFPYRQSISFYSRVECTLIHVVHMICTTSLSFSSLTHNAPLQYLLWWHVGCKNLCNTSDIPRPSSGAHRPYLCFHFQIRQSIFRTNGRSVCMELLNVKVGIRNRMLRGKPVVMKLCISGGIPPEIHYGCILL